MTRGLWKHDSGKLSFRHFSDFSSAYRVYILRSSKRLGPSLQIVQDLILQLDLLHSNTIIAIDHPIATLEASQLLHLLNPHY